MFTRSLLLLFCLTLPACGSLRTTNLLASSVQPGLKFSPTEGRWHITRLDTACFEVRPTITLEAKSSVAAGQIATYYRETLARHGWSVDAADHGDWVYAECKRSIPIPCTNPLIYRDDYIEIAIDQHGTGHPTTIRINLTAASHLDFPSEMLTWLTGNFSPLKYIL